MKVLVDWLEGEDNSLYVIDMTQEEYEELKPANNHWVGEWSDPSANEYPVIEQALVKFNLAMNEGGCEWAEEVGISDTWVGRFADRKVKYTGGALSVDDLITSGYFA